MLSSNPNGRENKWIHVSCGKEFQGICGEKGYRYGKGMNIKTI
jgi:hypothetical protein